MMTSDVTAHEYLASEERFGELVEPSGLVLRSKPSQLGKAISTLSFEAVCHSELEACNTARALTNSTLPFASRIKIARIENTIQIDYLDCFASRGDLGELAELMTFVSRVVDNPSYGMDEPSETPARHKSKI